MLLGDTGVGDAAVLVLDDAGVGDAGVGREVTCARRAPAEVGGVCPACSVTCGETRCGGAAPLLLLLRMTDDDAGAGDAGTMQVWAMQVWCRPRPRVACRRAGVRLCAIAAQL